MPEMMIMDPTTRTRVAVKYEFKPGVDYWQKIEAQCPAWIPPVTVDYGGAACTREDESTTVREYLINHDGKQVAWVMPFQEYIPAVDPAGNVVPLTVTTCRKPEDDETGFRDIIQARKKRQGWFIGTRDQEFQGLTGQEYAAFLCQVSEDRKTQHADRQAEYAKQFFSEAEKRAIEQANSIQKAVQTSTESNRELMLELAKTVGAEVAKAFNKGK